ncbi:MAG: AsmA-like C-terminal region-containing protein [Bacteroidales bacterium]
MMQQQPLTKKELFWKFLKTAGISGIVFLVGLFVVLLISTLIFQERIQNLFLQNINQNLRTEVQVDNIRLDLFRRFPNASLTFSNTRIFEPDPANSSDTLVQAGRIFLKFNLWDLIKGDYTLRQIEISNARIRPSIHQDGTNNFTIWNSSQQESTGSFSISLERIILNQVLVEFENQMTNTLLFLDAGKMTMSGSFQDEVFDLSAKGNLIARQIAFGETALTGGKPLEVDLVMEVRNQSEFVFRKGILLINQHAFSVLGNISNSAGKTDMDLQVSGNELNLQTLIEDLPHQWKTHLSDYRSKGEMTFNALIKGTYSSSGNPYVEADFLVSDAGMHHASSNLQLTNLSFSGTFNNGRRQNLSTSSFTFSDFSTRINQGTLEGNLSIFNFLKPDIDLNIEVDAEIPDLIHLLNIRQVAEASGKVQASLAFRGRLSNRNRFTPQDIGQVKATGNIEFSGAAFRMKDNPLDFTGFNGSFLFNDADLVVKSFSGKASSSDFHLQGNFRNVLPYLFLENEKIFIEARLISENLNFDEILQQGTAESDSTYQLKFSQHLGFHLEAQVSNLKFRKFQAQQIKGRASLQNKRFYASNLSFGSMQGQILANGFIDGTRQDYMTFGCQAELQQVDVHQLFYQMGNFGQTSIVDENIFGSISAELDFTARWSPHMDVDWGSLETTANIRVENGALVNYQPMIELSRFLRVDDLDHVTFSTLENQIHIKDRMIIIPEMEINSSALDLNITGQHSFENAIDYRLQVLLSDLLSRKNRQARNPQDQYGDIIDDGLGRTTLFLALTGTTDDPVFRYDYRGVREKLQQDLARERQNLRDVFRKEFGLTPKTQPDSAAKAAQKRKEQLKKQENGEFIIEWDL